MPDEPMDFDAAFPAFDPRHFVDKYPSKADFPPPYWDVAIRRVYNHELYRMARDPEYTADMRELARRAWEAIEFNDVEAFVCDLAGQLLDRALDKDKYNPLDPLSVSVHLSVILWSVFRESGGSSWLQHVLHSAIELLGQDDLTLSVEQAFAAGWAAGLADGEFGDHHTSSDEASPSE